MFISFIIYLYLNDFLILFVFYSKRINNQADLVFIRFLLAEQFFKFFKYLLFSYHQTIQLCFLFFLDKEIDLIIFYIFRIVADTVEVFVILL